MEKESKYRLITLLNLDTIKKMMQVLPEHDSLEKAAKAMEVDASGLSKYAKELELMGVLKITPRKEARESGANKYSIEPAFIGIALGFCDKLWIAGHPDNESIECGPYDHTIKTSEGDFFFHERKLEYAFRVIRVFQTKSRLYTFKMALTGNDGKAIQEKVCEVFDLGESMVREYLRDLEELELIRSEPKGKTKKYAPNGERTEQINSLM